MKRNMYIATKKRRNVWIEENYDLSQCGNEQKQNARENICFEKRFDQKQDKKKKNEHYI